MRGGYDETFTYIYTGDSWLVNIAFSFSMGGLEGGRGGGGKGNHIHMESVGKNARPFRKFKRESIII